MKVVKSNDVNFFLNFFTNSAYNEQFLTQTIITAVVLGNQEIVKVIWPHCSQTTKNLALDSVKSDDISMIRMLLEGGAEFSFRESEGGTAIPLRALTSAITYLLSEISKAK